MCRQQVESPLRRQQVPGEKRGPAGEKNSHVERDKIEDRAEAGLLSPQLYRRKKQHQENHTDQYQSPGSEPASRDKCRKEGEGVVDIGGSECAMTDSFSDNRLRNHAAVIEFRERKPCKDA